MSYRVLRNIAAVVLLATYLPMVVLSSLHVHHDTIDMPDDCLQCTGHFESQHFHDCDCQYCHFLSLNYFGETEEHSAVVLPNSAVFPVEIVEHAGIPCFGVSLLRAPPVRFCYIMDA